MKKYILFTILLIISLSVYYFYPINKIGENKITSIEVYKSKHKMYLYSNNIVVHTYSISLGGNPIGKKTKEGDQKTPEGKYIIDAKNDKSSCFKNLGISYPNASDKANHYTGGLIKIHGLRNGFGWVGKLHLLYDWTNGCIAVTNDEMEMLYNNVNIGTPIYIYP
jgi:murein L,D-transpeptidase YafK